MYTLPEETCKERERGCVLVCLCVCVCVYLYVCVCIWLWGQQNQPFGAHFLKILTVPPPAMARGSQVPQPTQRCEFQVSWGTRLCKGPPQSGHLPTRPPFDTGLQKPPEKPKKYNANSTTFPFLWNYEIQLWNAIRAEEAICQIKKILSFLSCITQYKVVIFAHVLIFAHIFKRYFIW